MRAAVPTELSGLVLSRSQPGVLWAHNDSGDSARVFALDANGALRGAFAVPGARNVDWEDIALGPRPDGRGDVLLIGDIGDNAAARREVEVYVVPEPRVGGGATVTQTAERIVLHYPDGAHDAEALLADPRGGGLVIVTKSYGGRARVYVAPRGARAGTFALRRTGSIALGFGEAITGGDVSADGATIVLRTYDAAFVFDRRRREALTAALRRRPCRAGADLSAEGQGEALALTRDGGAFVTVPEGARPAIRRYAPRR